MIAPTEDLSRKAAAAYALLDLVGSSALEAIAASLATPEFPGAIFPVYASGQVLCAAAPDWRRWRQLVPLLMARIGTTLSDFPSPVQDMTPSPRLAALLGGFVPRLWCRVELTKNGKLQALAIEACAQLVRDVATHASLIAAPSAPAGVVELLEAYEGAMHHGNLVQAEHALDALQHGNHVDAVNSRLLRLRWLDAHGLTRRAEALQVVTELQGIPLPEKIRSLVGRLTNSVAP